VILGDGLRLSRGSVLKLVQADRLDGWFEKLVLPPLDSGLHWQVVPSEDEVRLTVRDTPPPVSIEWLRRDSGDRIRVSGPWGTDTRAILRRSHDLRSWTSIQSLDSFAGLNWFPIPKADAAGVDGLTVYQAILAPAGSPN